MAELKGSFPMEPKVILSVRIIEHRNISLGRFHDAVLDTPDPYVTVQCPWLDKKHKYTTPVKDNQPTAKVEETFRFIIPKDKQQIHKQPIKIHIYDDDIFYDDEVGEISYDAAKLWIGTTVFKTFVLKHKHGEIDVEISKYVQEQPDFRWSEDLCDGEKEFMRLRMPKVRDGIQKLLGEQLQEFEREQTPVISVVGSGGGYRAIIGMSGGMAALKDAGVLDTLAYVSGLSGSSWYLNSAFAHDGVRNETQDEYHEWLRRQMKQDAYDDLLDLSTFSHYEKNFHSVKKVYKQPTSFVDYFGYVVGNKLLDEKMHKTMTGLRETISGVNVPYPIFTAVHAKDKEPTHEFYVRVENTPHEISMPRFGVNIATEQFGSHWDEGVITRECPEFPLHYYIGSCGCAFSILLRTMVDFGTEENPEFVHLVDELRHHGTRSPAIALAVANRRRMRPTMIRRQSTIDEDATSLLPKGLLNDIRNSELFEDRNFLIDRTAIVTNFAHNLPALPEVYPKKQDVGHKSDFHKAILERMGHRTKQAIDTEEEEISICDAGIVKNVSVECMLRDSRRSDLIIVFDMNHYLNDEYFDYMVKPILQSAEHAWRDGLPFPPINVKELVNSPPKEFLVFESDSDDCPTVLWFTLCNKSFKNLKNYKPKRPFDASKNDGRPFNDFPVFSKDGNYSTYKFNNTGLQFDQLHQLMYHNVTSHIEDIKKHIAQAVERRKMRLQNGNA